MAIRRSDLVFFLIFVTFGMILSALLLPVIFKEQLITSEDEKKTWLKDFKDLLTSKSLRNASVALIILPVVLTSWCIFHFPNHIYTISLSIFLGFLLGAFIISHIYSTLLVKPTSEEILPLRVLLRLNTLSAILLAVVVTLSVCILSCESEFKYLDSDDILKIATIFATLSIGIGAMAIAYYTVVGDMMTQMIDITSKLHSENNTFDINKTLVETYNISGYDILNFQQNNIAMSETRLFLWGLFKLNILLTVLFIVLGIYVKIRETEPLRVRIVNAI